MKEKWILVVHAIFLLSECTTIPTFTQFIKLLISEWRWKLYYQTNKICDTNPACCVRVILHPCIQQTIHIISINNAKILKFCIFQTFNNCCNGQIHDKPWDEKSKWHEINLSEISSTTMTLVVVRSKRCVTIIIINAINVFYSLRQFVHNLIPIFSSCTSKKKNNCISYTLEIVLLINQVLMFDCTE